MSWSIGDIAPGMLRGEGRDWAARVGVNILKGMGCHSSEQTHHARTSDHAFSTHLKCSTNKATINVKSLTNAETCKVVQGVRDCVVPSVEDGHHDDDPRIMVGLCPRYHSDASVAVDMREGQQAYTNRLLSTPLVWEEPVSYFFECTKAGVFLWSEEGGRYGDMVIDKCLTERSEGSGTYEAALNLSWGAEGPKPFLELGVGEGSYKWYVGGNPGRGGVFSPSGVAATSTLPFQSGDLVPTVTFLSANCKASVV